MRVRAMSLGLVVLVGCLGQADPEQRAGAQAERGFLPDEPVVDLGADPRFVLRQVLGAEDGAVSSLAGEPFSHRSRSWHVYPFTAYPDARPAVRLTVNDPRLADGASRSITQARRS